MQEEIHIPEPLVPDSSLNKVEISIENLKGINGQIVIKFWQNLFKQEVKYYILRFIS
jgi:hypothetical protein